MADYLSVDDAIKKHSKDKNIEHLVNAAVGLSKKAESDILEHKPKFSETYINIHNDLKKDFYDKKLDGINPDKEIGDLGDKIKDILVKHFETELSSTEEGKKEIDSLKNLGFNKKDYKNALLKTVASKHITEKGEPAVDYVGLLEKKDTKIKQLYGMIDAGHRAETHAHYLGKKEGIHLQAHIGKNVPLYEARNFIKEYAQDKGHGIHKNIMHIANPVNLILGTGAAIKENQFKDEDHAAQLGIKLNQYEKDLNPARKAYEKQQDKAA